VSSLRTVSWRREHRSEQGGESERPEKEREREEKKAERNMDVKGVEDDVEPEEFLDPITLSLMVRVPYLNLLFCQSNSTSAPAWRVIAVYAQLKKSSPPPQPHRRMR
jgi:hypothetical protein